MKKGWRKESKVNPQMERGAFRSRNHGSSSLYWKGKRRKIEVCRRPISDNVCSSFLYGSQYLSCSQSGSPAFADEGVNYHFSCEYYRPKKFHSPSVFSNLSQSTSIEVNNSDQRRKTNFSLSLFLFLSQWNLNFENLFFRILSFFYTVVLILRLKVSEDYCSIFRNICDIVGVIFGRDFYGHRILGRTCVCVGW